MQKLPIKVAVTGAAGQIALPNELGVLLDDKHGDAESGIELADHIEDTIDEERRERQQRERHRPRREERRLVLRRERVEHDGRQEPHDALALDAEQKREHEERYELDLGDVGMVHRLLDVRWVEGEDKSAQGGADMITAEMPHQIVSAGAGQGERNQQA